MQDRDMMVPKLLACFLAKKVAGVIGASNAVLEKWRAYLPEQRLHRIPLGFAAPEPCLMTTRKERGLAIALVADFVRWKNHLLLLEAIRILQDKGIDVSAHIIGHCVSQESVRIVSELRGFVKEHELKNIQIASDGGNGPLTIAESDVLVSCTDGESFGRTIMEALALGRPVVAVASGAVPEILAGCPAAVLCQASPVSLAEAIEQWQAAETREACAEGARRFAARYSLSAMADKTLQVLYQIR